MEALLTSVLLLSASNIEIFAVLMNKNASGNGARNALCIIG